MSDKSPAVQFYFKDFLVDTAHLTAEQVGCYIRLLGYAWTGIAGCPQGAIPVDLKILGRLTQVGTKKGKRILVPVTDLWEKKGDFFFHKRLVEELQKQREWSAKSRLGGIASGKTRNQRRTTVEPKGQPKGNSSSSSSSSPSSSYSETLEIRSSLDAGNPVKDNGSADKQAHLEEAEKSLALFKNESTRHKIHEWLGYLENEQHVPGKRLTQTVKELFNLRQTLNMEGGKFDAERLFRVAVERSMKYKAKNVDYTRKVIRGLLQDIRDGKTI